MNDVKNPLDQGKNLLAEATQFLMEHESFTVTTDDQYQQAGEIGKAAKSRAQEIEELRTSITQPINESLRKINALFKPAAEKYAQVDRIASRAMLDYSEKKRQEAIQREKELRALQEKEKAKMERQAERAENKGDTTTADALRSAVQQMPAAPIVNTAPPKVQGMTRRSNWKVRIDDRAALIKWLIENPAYQYLLDVNEPELNKLATAMKKHTNIPHITVWDDAKMVRTGK